MNQDSLKLLDSQESLAIKTFDIARISIVASFSNPVDHAAKQEEVKR